LVCPESDLITLLDSVSAQDLEPLISSQDRLGRLPARKSTREEDLASLNEEMESV